MASYRTQQDLINYIADLERRISLLETSATRIDRTTARASVIGTPGRIIFDTTTGKLYAGDNAKAWNALW